MNFSKIAFKNVKNKFSSYLIYLISTMFSVTIFNLFSSIYYNPSFQTFRFGHGKMSVLFKGVAVAVFLFAAIFILYSNDYFIKTRKKEMAIYSLLGMKKEQIAILMFMETFIIGILATILGTLIGTFSSGYFTSLLLKFMAAGTNVTFSVDVRAIIATVVVFLLLFTVSGAKAYKTIYEYKLIDLLAASKKGEMLPDFSVAGGVGSIALLIAAYIISEKMNVNMSGMKLLFPAFFVVLLVSAGSFLLFRNLIIILLMLLKKNKHIYFKTTNLISISQISYRVKSNAKMLSVVSILCAITITMLSAAYSIYRGVEDSVKYYAPYSYLCKNISEDQYQRMVETVSQVGEVELSQEDKISLVIVNMQMQDSESDLKTECYLMSESMYLQIIKHTGVKKGSFNHLRTDFAGGLEEGECYFLDHNQTSDACRKLVGKTLQIIRKDETMAYEITGANIHKYLGMIDGFKKSTIVVADQVYNQYVSDALPARMTTFYGFLFDQPLKSQATAYALDQIVEEKTDTEGKASHISYIGFYKNCFALYGSYVFIGLFIGVLFLLAVGSVLYYKLIIEAQEEAVRYQILKKTGMRSDEIRRSIAKQLGMVYVLPLIIGLLHTFFALRTYNRTMDVLGQETPTMLNAVMVVGIYVIVYGMFYLLSVHSYGRIVLRK